MRLTRLLGAALGTGFLFLALSSGANAYDHWRDRERHWRHERWGHDHYVHERPVVVRERPVVVERPVMMAPQYVQPMMPYNQGPSGLNLNFNIPLQ